MDEQSKIVDATKILEMTEFLTKNIESFKRDIEYLQGYYNSLKDNINEINGHIDNIIEELDSKDDKLELS